MVQQMIFAPDHREYVFVGLGGEFGRRPGFERLVA
jgi:hypothetical protein